MTVDTAAPGAAPSATGGPPAARKQGLLIVAVVLGIFALVAGAYALGSRTNRHTTTVLTGTAHVGDHVASIRVGDGGWDYGFRDTVSWFDVQGTEHEDSWPSCLPAGHDVLIRFGAVTAELPDGGRVRDVVWVDCRR